MDLQGEPATVLHFSYSWNHQLFPNFWGEITWGFSNLTQFPSQELSTPLQALSLRLKYTHAAPFYSFFQPYIGYRVSFTNPEDPLPEDTTSAERQAELIEGVEDSGPIVGVTILKRLVPGWFARFDLGTDIVNIGIALEF